jgi:ABC-2 type transport system ATP-binding protein
MLGELVFVNSNVKKENVLQVQDIFFGYKKKEVLRGISFNIIRSSIVAIVGNSGSGKSTLLKLISGINVYDKGKVLINGSKLFFEKHNIGYVPQEISLIDDLTVKENIDFFAQLSGINKSDAKKNIDFLMDSLNVKDFLDSYIGELSGGQKVRANILCSLIHNPDLIIMDEPFVGLDYYNRKLLWHFISFMNKKKKTIVLTTHMLTEIEDYVDKVIVLKSGKVFIKGSTDFIKKKLSINYVYEVSLSSISNEKFIKLKGYCMQHGISILQNFKNYFMFSIINKNQRDKLDRYLTNSIGVNVRELGYRTPNLDEVFLKTKSEY